MDLHTLMSPYAEDRSARAESLLRPGGRHRADGPAAEQPDTWSRALEPRHRAEPTSRSGALLTV